MKIIFAGTPDFAVPTLDKLVESGHNVELVISQEDSRRGRGKKLQPTPVKAKALELGIEVFQPENINSEEAIEKIKSIEADLIVVIAYGQIVRKEILEAAKYGCINIHASLLPKYRGAAPINWVLINGEKETGISLMQMDEGLDTGDILAMESIEIEDHYNSQDIHDILSELGGKLLVEKLDDIINGNVDIVKQDDDKSSYAPMIFRETGHIDWSKSAEEINNLMRGVQPWPGAFSYYEDEMMKIFNIEVREKTKDGEVGEIVDVSPEGVLVNTIDDAILIKEVQFPNKRRMQVKDYILGNEIKLGTILN